MHTKTEQEFPSSGPGQPWLPLLHRLACYLYWVCPPHLCSLVQTDAVPASSSTSSDTLLLTGIHQEPKGGGVCLEAHTKEASA